MATLKPEQVERQRPGVASALALGTNLAVGIAVFTAIGYYIDRRRGGGTAWTLTGIVVGLLYGAYEVWKVIRQLSTSAEHKDKQD